jgi:hypothetical protein
MSGTRFTVTDTEALRELAELCPVYDDQDAVGVLTTAILGTDHARGLIDGPCSIATDLLADHAHEGRVDGYRIFIRPFEDPDAPWIASNILRTEDRDREVPAEPGGSWSYDTAAIIRDAVKIANDMLAWSER